MEKLSFLVYIRRMVRKLGRIKIDPGEFSYDGDPAPIEVLLPPGAVVFNIIASGSTPWLYFYYEGPNWRKKTAGFVMQRFLLWVHGETYSGPLGPHVGSVVLNGTICHLFRLEA
jgi:hypothetical protein